MKIIILGLIITASILILYASVSDMMNFEIQNTDNELIDSIYSEKEIFTEAPYSGNTNDKAQHVIIIVKDSWKQGCEIDDSCFLPYEKIIGVGETILFVNQDEFEHNVRLRGDPNYLHFLAKVQPIHVRHPANHLLLPSMHIQMSHVVLSF